MPAPERTPPDALPLLRDGDLTVHGRMPWSSNGTFFATVAHEGDAMDAVYKPVRGERALWDFPPGLFRREVAAFELSEALGWGLVPETVARDGPFGFGSAQRFAPSDFSQHYFTLLELPERHRELQAICALDLLMNNADRKSGHCLLGEDGRIRAIDHGLCFHADPKLRTVIWDFGGSPIPEELVSDVARLAGSLPASMAALLSEEELSALRQRAEALLRSPRFPHPRSSRAYPWPLV